MFLYLQNLIDYSDNSSHRFGMKELSVPSLCVVVYAFGKSGLG